MGGVRLLGSEQVTLGWAFIMNRIGITWFVNLFLLQVSALSRLDEEFRFLSAPLGSTFSQLELML